MELKYMTWGAKSYFVVVDDDVQVAEIEISAIVDSIFTIKRTEIYDSEKGRGLDTVLVRYVVQYARDNELKIRPLCPFFQAAIGERTELNDVITP